MVELLFPANLPPETLQNQRTIVKDNKSLDDRNLGVQRGILCVDLKLWNRIGPVREDERFLVGGSVDEQIYGLL